MVVESSGGYERALLFDLLDAGLPAAHVNPRVVRDYARGFNQLAKTDPIDGRVLGCYGRERSRQPRLFTGGINCGTCCRTSTAADANCSSRSPP